MAGGSVRGSINYGETNDCSGKVTRNPVHCHDLQRAIQHKQQVGR